MMDGYSITEAASVLGVPTERVWELLARGVLAGAPEGETGMRVFLQPRPAPAPVTASFTEDAGAPPSNGPERELSPFRELLTEFRNLTERYGQALLALGESRGEVASLRSRVDLLEARIDLRLPMGTPAVPWPPQVTEPAEPEDEEANRRRRRGARRATESFAEALARAEDPSPADLPAGPDSGAAFAAESEAEDADRSLPRDVLPAEPVLVAEEAATAAAEAEESDEAEPPLAAELDVTAPEAMVDESEPAEDEPAPRIDELEPVEPEPALVLDQVDAVAFEPAASDFDDLQLADAGAWAIPADLAEEAPEPELPDEHVIADAPPSEEPAWSGEAEPEATFVVEDTESDEEADIIIEVEALPGVSTAEAPSAASFELEPDDAQPAVAATVEGGPSAATEGPAADAEPEPVDFDAERYTTVIDQPDWFEAEADDWSTGTANREETGEPAAAVEPSPPEPNAPADAPEPETRQSGADEMEVAGGGQVAAAEPEPSSEGALPGSRELDEALEAYRDTGARPTAQRDDDDEWPPATLGGSPAPSSAQGSGGYVSPPAYRSTLPNSSATRAYRRLRRIFPT